jgi:hypothetical protein
LDYERDIATLYEPFKGLSSLYTGGVFEKSKIGDAPRNDWNFNAG